MHRCLLQHQSRRRLPPNQPFPTSVVYTARRNVLAGSRIPPSIACRTLTRSMSADSFSTMEFRDRLPRDCPPAGHEVIDSVREVYRLVRHDPPQALDFRNSHDTYPGRRWGKNSDPCHLRAVSVWETPDGCRGVHTRGPLLIARIVLRAGAGAIIPFGRLGHFSWWPSQEFDIPANAEIVVREEEES